MPVSVIVGGQFGSEGKGKVAHAFAQKRNASVAIRVGGPNSGHTAVDKHGEPQILRQLPTAALLDDPICVLPAGSYIDVDVLRSEIERFRISRDRLLIDPNAVVISAADRETEQRSGLQQHIGSTQSGTGAAVIGRLSRQSKSCLAQTDDRLADFVRPTRLFLRERLRRGERLIIEGTQGFGLSVLHSQYYPYTTSRDTTAAGFLAESGLSPLDVDQIALVIRAFPIRVAGHSGYLPGETNWDQVTAESQSYTAIVEHTSVTRKVRRVGRFDAQVVRDAITANNPTDIVLNHLDHVDARCRNGVITAKATDFVRHVEAGLERDVSYIGLSDRILIERHRVDEKPKASQVANAIV